MDENVCTNELQTPEEENDVFDFVDEDEPVPQTETVVEVEDEDKDDGFQFVEEEEQPCVPVVIQSEIKQISTNGCNKDKISSLLSSFKSKYVNSYTDTEEEVEIPKKEFISNCNFISEKNNISIEKIMKNIPDAKTNLDIFIHPVSIEEIVNCKNKTNKIVNAINLPNSVVYKLFFKIIDLKNTYVNLIQVSFGAKIKKDNAILEEEKTQTNDVDLFCEVDEIKEEKQTHKLEINEDLLALTSTVKVVNIQPKEVVAETKFDENSIMELLKTISNKSPIIINEEKNEEEENNKELESVIANLPQYHFLVSKCVEYPDSLFNI